MNKRINAEQVGTNQRLDRDEDRISKKKKKKRNTVLVAMPQRGNPLFSSAWFHFLKA